MVNKLIFFFVLSTSRERKRDAGEGQTVITESNYFVDVPQSN